MTCGVFKSQGRCFDTCYGKVRYEFLVLTARDKKPLPAAPFFSRTFRKPIQRHDRLGS